MTATAAVDKKPNVKRLKNKRPLKTQNAKNVTKKPKIEIEEVPSSSPENADSTSNSPTPIKKERWTNRTRVLIFSSRGVSFRLRHLMNDIKMLMPHSKGETKLEKKERLGSINEICEMRNCQICVFFEMKKRMDAYMWISAAPNGPSVKFSLENVHTMQELRMTGNCLKGSRPILAFGKEFETEPHWRVIRELLFQVFNTPNHHPKSQPFVDHVLSLSIADSRIWFRNYQIVDETKASLTEIGPRFTMNPIAVFSGSFGGTVLWQNPDYVPPTLFRRALKMKNSNKYREKFETKLGHEERLKNPLPSYNLDPTDELFEVPRTDDNKIKGKGKGKKSLKSSE